MLGAAHATKLGSEAKKQNKKTEQGQEARTGLLNGRTLNPQPQRNNPVTV